MYKPYLLGSYLMVVMRNPILTFKTCSIESFLISHSFSSVFLGAWTFLDSAARSLENMVHVQDIWADHSSVLNSWWLYIFASFCVNYYFILHCWSVTTFWPLLWHRIQRCLNSSMILRLFIFTPSFFFSVGSIFFFFSFSQHLFVIRF